MPRSWKYVGDGVAPVPGFPVQDVTDVELRAAASAYAERWGEAERKAVAANIYAIVTGKGRLEAAYVPAEEED